MLERETGDSYLTAQAVDAPDDEGFALSAVWDEKEIGLIGHCVCDNGRALKKDRPNLLVKDMENMQSNMKRRMFKKNSQ